jgi:imidazolonepropionase-like amidohydrolase
LILIKNALVKTITNGDLENTSILLKDGKIEKIGANIEAPEGTHTIDATGKVVTPGLIDCHSHVGAWEEGLGWEGNDINEMTNPVNPGLRIIDAVNPDDIGFWDARRGGVTTVQTMPGSGNIIGGLMIAMKTAGNVVDDMVIKNPTGMKAALGENPKRNYGMQNKEPKTRMGNAYLLRKALVETKQYIKNKNEYDIRMENLSLVINKEIPLRIHAHRADDILTAIRISKEFDIDITIEHCTEGHKVAKELAENNIWSNIGPSLWQRAKVETKDITPATPAIVSQAGGKVTLITDHNIVPQHYFRIAAGLAVRSGLKRETAWEAITINPAKVIGIDDKVGSLEVGKDADIVIWTDDPFEPTTHCLVTIIDGNVVYEKEDL